MIQLPNPQFCDFVPETWQKECLNTASQNKNQTTQLRTLRKKLQKEKSSEINSNQLVVIAVCAAVIVVVLALLICVCLWCACGQTRTQKVVLVRRPHEIKPVFN